MISSTQPTTSNVSSSGIFDTTQHIQAEKAGIWPLADLYPFTSFTFTNAGQTGQTGPIRATCLSSYNTVSNPWLNDTAYFNVVTAGYQLWTAPRTGSYRVTSIGASGGDGNTGRGAGAKMLGVFTFSKGQKLKILVGQQGVNSLSDCGAAQKGGGGGGSFVVSEDNLTAYIVAGGGGGDSFTGFASTGAVVTTTAVAGASSGGAAGTSGGGGGIGSGCVTVGSGGGGFTSNGTNSGGGFTGGLSFINGGTGGVGGGGSNGGFGGGGGSSSYAGGGGGGYSGGGGGGLSTCFCNSLGAGGGGGSINSGTSQTNTAAFNNTTHGSVLIEKL